MSTRGSIETRIVKYFKEADLDMVDVMHEALGRIVAGRKRDAKGKPKARKPRAASGNVPSGQTDEAN